MTSSIVAIALVALYVEAQPQSFEVASVKVHKGGGDATRSIDAGSFRYTNVTLGELIIIAYRVKRYQINGPDWVVSSTSEDRYDVLAKTSESTPPSQVPLLLRPLLSERFKLQFHREMRELPAYALRVARSGSKLQLGDGGDSTATPDGRGGIAFENYPMSAFATLLSNTQGVGRPVVDRTGLTGKYKFGANLFDTPPELGLTKVESNLGVGDDPVSSPVLSNLEQQLGLRLESIKLPTEMIVIDHVEKVPTEN